MAQAIIDLGTNTFNLLVFEHEPLQASEGRLPLLKIIHEEELPVFLGQAGLEKGHITQEAFDRGIVSLKAHVATARSLGATAITGIGCSTFRNSSNAQQFIQAAADLGVQVQVIPGEEEAEIILDGVRLAVPLGSRPALVMDIGGGSIEFILATEKALMWKRSFEIGVTRTRERIPITDPITVDEELRIAEFFDAQLEPLWQVVERHEPHLLIGSAGSFDSIARMLFHDIPDGSISRQFSADGFHALKDRLMRMDRAQRKQVPGLPEHRVDNIIYALIVIERVLIAGGIREMAWSRYSLKEGAAARMIKSGDQGIC